VFHNRFPQDLPDELALARWHGIVPLRPSDPGFAELVTADTVKWVLTIDGELLFIPEKVGGDELAHPVMTNGGPVLAAGEADIVDLGGGEYGLLRFTGKSGHYQPDPQSVRVARRVFEAVGIRTLRRRS
jgi:hypothetical protein